MYCASSSSKMHFHFLLTNYGKDMTFQLSSWLWRGQLLLTGQRRPGSSKLVVEGTALVGRPKKTWQFQVGCGEDSSCWQAKEDLAVPSWLWRGQLLLTGQRRPGSSKLVVEGTALVDRPKKTWLFQFGCGWDSSC